MTYLSDAVDAMKNVRTELKALASLAMNNALLSLGSDYVSVRSALAQASELVSAIQAIETLIESAERLMEPPF